MKKNLLCLGLLFIFISSSWAQVETADSSSNKDNEYFSIAKYHLGTGVGVGYGRCGIQVKTNLLEYIDLHLGVGFNSFEFNYAMGASLTLFKNSRVRPRVSILYGATGVIIVDNVSVFNASFYGIAFGAGLNIYLSKYSENYLSIGINGLPPTQDFINAGNELKSNPNFVLDYGPSSWGISLGYFFYISD